jgi:hypothetical protein
MSSDLLIHATLTVSGGREDLSAADARIRALLAAEALEGSVETRHGEAALCYDFKLRGGIPFPVFAAVSQEFAGLAVTAEWVNAGAGRSGRARLAGGRIVEQDEDRVTAARTANRWLRVAADGRLELGLLLMRLGRDEWAGYAIDHERDALIHLLRIGEVLELRATEGEPEWSVVWRLRDAADTPPARPCMRVVVAAALHAELDRAAREFVARWIWLDQSPAVDTAIERAHYARLGYPVRAANLRSLRLGDLAGDESGSRLHDTLEPEARWVAGVVRRCWGGSDE